MLLPAEIEFARTRGMPAQSSLGRSRTGRQFLSSKVFAALHTKVDQGPSGPFGGGGHAAGTDFSSLKIIAIFAGILRNEWSPLLIFRKLARVVPVLSAQSQRTEGRTWNGSGFLRCLLRHQDRRRPGRRRYARRAWLWRRPAMQGRVVRWPADALRPHDQR